MKFWKWGFKLNKLLFLLQKYQHNMSIWCQKRVKFILQPNSFTLMSTISAASTATSVPVPIAIPTSAWARAGESLTPSPTMATLIPSFWICLTFFTLWDGNTSANTRWIPTWVNKRLSLIILVFTTLLQRTPTFSMSESVWVLISIGYFDFTYTFV